MAAGRIICSVLAAALLLPALSCAQAEERFRTLADIEAALDPLEFLADHDGIRVGIDLAIRFRFASAELEPAADEQLAVLGGALSGERLAGHRILLVGHTDARGDAASNLALSQARAEAVRTALIDRFGVAPDRLRAEGLGEAALLPGLAPDDAAHRRVQILLDEGQDASALGAQDEAGTNDAPDRIEAGDIEW